MSIADKPDMNATTTIGKQLSREMNHAMMGLQLVDPTFQRNVFKRLKLELTQKIDSLVMNSERKDYYYHQLNNVHAMDELMDLVQEMNYLQIQDASSVGAREIIYPIISSHRVSWTSLLYLSDIVQ